MKNVSNRKESTILSSMEATFTPRRKYILAEGVMLADVREKYPFLFSYSGIVGDYNILTAQNLEDVFSAGEG